VVLASPSAQAAEEEEEEAAEAGRGEPAADELEAAIGELGDSSDLRDAIPAPDE
jgi:hypothetical protein